jgi:hypothetical protein
VNTPPDLPDRRSGERPVQSHLQKYIPSRLPQIKSITRAVSSHRGAIAIVTNAGRDAVDASARLTMCASRGRRSRVVLTPRCRRQVGGGNSAGDGDKRARSPGRARGKPLKPLRAGMPGESGEPVATTLVCFLFLHTRLRVHRAPGIPHALIYFWAKNSCIIRTLRRRGNAEVCVFCSTDRGFKRRCLLSLPLVGREGTSRAKRTM